MAKGRNNFGLSVINFTLGQEESLYLSSAKGT